MKHKIARQLLVSLDYAIANVVAENSAVDPTEAHSVRMHGRFYFLFSFVAKVLDNLPQVLLIRPHVIVRIVEQFTALR